MTLLTTAVSSHVLSLGAESLPAYVYDLAELRSHVAAVRSALPERIELYYAVKANAEPPLLASLAGQVDGFDVSSAGELVHARSVAPASPLALSGPGKSDADLMTALAADVERVHVESLQELEMLSTLADRPVSVLLRVNLPMPDGLLGGSALAMGGRPSPFGLEPAQAEQVLRRVGGCGSNRLNIVGIHTHLASGLDAASQLAVAQRVSSWSADLFGRHGIPLREVNLGGGMAVSYTHPEARFDWATFGEGLEQLMERHPRVTFRIEPGRSITAYSGWYATEVLDAKRSHGRDFAVLRGGTHHLRTPATKGHDQPFSVIPTPSWPHPWSRPVIRSGRASLVGQLCTPRDVLAHDADIEGDLHAGDRVVFAMAGAYAWNISHHQFLMHPPPTFHFLDDETQRVAPATRLADVGVR